MAVEVCEIPDCSTPTTGMFCGKHRILFHIMFDGMMNRREPEVDIEEYNKVRDYITSMAVRV